MIPEEYILRVKQRSQTHYYIGYIIRLYHSLKFGVRRFIARKKGATIGNNSIIPLRLALKANSNLVIGNNVSINSSCFDLRRKIVIHDNVIINRDVGIIRLSHDYNSMDFRLKEYESLVIESYSWLATGSKILPSCSLIAYGTVLGAYSVLPYNTEKMSVYSGFPAKIIKKRENVWTNLVVVSLNGGDWNYYKQARKQKI